MTVMVRTGLLTPFLAAALFGCSSRSSDAEARGGSADCDGIVSPLSCGESCEGYATALAACFNEYYDSGDPYSFADSCDAIDEEAYDWSCAIRALEAEDCSTLEGVTNASRAAGACAD